MAETNIPPALQLKELLASYPLLSDMSPSSWFVWSDNPALKPLSHLVRVCHADMRYHPAGYDYLVTAVPRADKVSLAYLRMLIHGPFKAFSDLIELVRLKNIYYLQCNDLNKWPAPVLFNFCIASRVPIEFQNQLDGWTKLREEGYPEVLAFLLSHSVGGDDFKNERDFPMNGHDWFDPSADWKRIIDGSPDLSACNYSQAPGNITPSNVIWGKSEVPCIIRKLNNLKAAEHFGFKFPSKPSKPQLKPFDLTYKNLAWDHDAMGVVQAAQAHLGQVQGLVHPAFHPAPLHWAPAEPVLGQPQPQLIHVDPIDQDDEDNDFEAWLEGLDD